MLKTFAEWAARKLLVLHIQERLRQLESSVTLAERLIRGDDAMEDTVKFTRILLSGDERQEITGTEEQIKTAAYRMAGRTKCCVTVAVAVAYHHRRGCSDRRTGGFDVVGN